MLISIEEIGLATILFIWIVILTRFLTKSLYEALVKRGVKERVAIYYNLSLIHI